MRRILTAAAVALLFLFALPACAQTILSVTAVPTPSGVVSSKYRDGDDGTAGLPLIWATVPNFLNKIEGTPFSVDLRQYLTEPGTPDATLSIVGSLPTGWTLDTDDLEYDGTGTGSAAVVVRATRDSVTSDSNSFAVESVAAESTDETAPTIITGVEVTLDGSNDPVITFDAAADVRVSGEDVSGLDTFTVRRGATPLTPTAYTGSAFVPTYSYTEVGTVANNSAVQDGADWDVTGEGNLMNVAGLNHAWVPAAVTGDFTHTTRIAAITGGTDSGRGGGLCVADDETQNSRLFCTHNFAASTNSRCYYRTATGSTTPVQSAAIAESLPWHRITRSGDSWTASVSADGNSFGELCSVTFAMNQTVLSGTTGLSNQAGTATTVSHENVTLTTRPRQTFTDTSGVPGSSSYTVISTDGATNVAAASTAVVAPDVPAGSGSDTPDFVDTAVTLAGQTPVAAADLSAFTAAIADADCGETVTVTAGYTITGSRTINAGACGNDEPYIIRCAFSGAIEGDCPVTGAWTITGDNVIVSGFDFNGSAARVIVRGDYFRFIGNRARAWSCGGSQGQFLMLDGDNGGGFTGTEIAYNHLGPGASITGSFCWTVKLYYATAQGSVPTTGHIHHNRFQGTNSSGSTDDRSDAIELGEGASPSWLPTATFGWYVEDNYFCDFDLGGDAVADSKIGGTWIRRNTGCDGIDGRLSLRMGSFGGLESNWWPAASSTVVNVNGRGHKIVCNRANTWVVAGTDAWNVVGAQYAASFEILLDGNIGTGLVGKTYNTAGGALLTDTAVDETVVRNHSGGAISLGLETDTTGISPTLPSAYNCVPAFALTTDDVGYGELASTSATYRANRGL